MKITCALSEKQIQDLYKLIAYKMLNASKEKPFDASSFMTGLFKSIESKKGVETASKFLQVVPALILDVASNRKFAAVDFDIQAVRNLNASFMTEKSGLLSTFYNFKPKASISDFKDTVAISTHSKNSNSQSNVENKDDDRLKPDNAFTSTLQEFENENPDAQPENNIDSTRVYIYKTLDKVAQEISKKNELEQLTLEGTPVRLRAVKLGSLAALETKDKQKLIDQTSLNLIARKNALRKAGKEKPEFTDVKDIIALAITNNDGEYLYFDNDGNITDKENGKIVYQLMRDVRESNGKLNVTNFFGIPALQTTQEMFNGMLGFTGLSKEEYLETTDQTEEEALAELDSNQQKSFKELMLIKNQVIKNIDDGNKVLFAITNTSKGVEMLNQKPNQSIQTYINNETLKEESFKSLRIVQVSGEQFQRGRAVINIDNVDFELDRINIGNSLIEKIASVLTSDTIDNMDKIAFYEQFLSNSTTPQRRRITAIYKSSTGEAIVQVRPVQTAGNPSQYKTLDLSSKNAKNEIIDALTNESVTSNKTYSTLLNYNTDLAKGNIDLFDLVDGEFQISNQTYAQFLKELNPKLIFPTNNKGETLKSSANRYMYFSKKSKVIERINSIKEPEIIGVGQVSKIREAKDNLVQVLKSNISREEILGEVIISNIGSGKSAGIIFAKVSVPGVKEPVIIKFDKSITKVPVGGKVIFKVKDVETKQGLFTDVVQVISSKNNKPIGLVLETDYLRKEKPRTPQAIKAEDKQYTTPDKVPTPDEQVKPKVKDAPKKTTKKRLGDLFRKSELNNNVTAKQIDEASEWWDNSPLADFINVEHMANIVNSDAYAKFVISGRRLQDVSIELFTDSGGNSTDLYHEAWHAFSQLYLTKADKTRLYNAYRKKYSNPELSSFDIEEKIAEEFRTYALDPNKSDSPVKNTIFRRILNFLKKLFGSRTIQDELFEKLYFAGKNPKLLNNYKPLVDNAMFNIMNRSRGVENVETGELELNYQDAKIVSDQIDSALSELIDDVYNDKSAMVAEGLLQKSQLNKANTIKILSNPESKYKAYEIIKERFEEKLDEYKNKLEKVSEEDFAEKRILNNTIRLLESAIENWGDDKNGIIKFHLANSTFDIVNQKYIELNETEKDLEEDLTEPSKAEETERYADKKVGDKSLFELAGKETLYIMKSLFKIDNGERVVGKLGFPELVDFSKAWNIVTKTIGGVKDPVEMYEKLIQASYKFPELKQLIESKIPDPRNINTIEEFNVKASFWQDFKKTRLKYIQLTLFNNEEGYSGEVTNASNETTGIVNAFKSRFQATIDSPYITKSTDNKSYLNIENVLKDFSDSTGNLDLKKQIEFANAIGIYLQDLIDIRKELGKNPEGFGLPFIFKALKKLNKLNKTDTDLGKEITAYVANFKRDPLGTLSKDAPEEVLKFIPTQSAVIKKLINLQSELGTEYSNFSVLNAEKNLVFEYTEDNSVSMIVHALNDVEAADELWTNDKYQYMKYLNPNINSFTEQSQLLKSIFNMQMDYKTRKADSKLDLFMMSGTQIEGSEGSNTTSLDVQSKFIQELNTMLKGGAMEFMRHASKSSSFGVKTSGVLQKGMRSGDKYLYVDIDMFEPNGAGESFAFNNIMIGYIQAELTRIQKVKNNRSTFEKYKGYNRVIGKDKDGKNILAGEVFTAFDNVLTPETKRKLIENVKDGDLKTYLKSDPILKADIAKDVKEYFQSQADKNYKQFSENPYYDESLMNKLDVFENLSQEDKEKLLMKAYTYNAWIHNFETANLFYGDIVQYNHDKEEMHKRNTGSTSGGRGFLTDYYSQQFVNNVLSKSSYAETLSKEPGKGDIKPINYDGTFNTAIMQDVLRKSVYLNEIEKGLRKDYKERGLSQKEIDRRIVKELKPYEEMEEADGQGWATFDSYRTLRILEKNWDTEQEVLFQKIVNKEKVNAEDVTKMFPVYKLQNFGAIANTMAPVTAMHKFAVAPLIPSVIEGSELQKIHENMMREGINYVTFQTGSKVGSITNANGKADSIFTDDTQIKIKDDIKFTNNKIYLEYLKNVTSVPTKYKGKTIFSTQLRKMILEGIYEEGNAVNATVKQLAEKYSDTVSNYTELLKEELLEEIGYKKVNGKYEGDISKFLDLIQRELTRKDMPEHLIKYLSVSEDGNLTKDLSVHILSDDIEKMLVALVEKRIVKQKVKGESLVQVASSMTNGIWDKGLSRATEEDIKKYLGSNNLPFYKPGKDGKTDAMKVAIALQGDFRHLLKLKDNDGVEIGSIEKLNELIKDDVWLDKDNNRKTITMTAVRIPVQGLNSMEFMEVYHFLDPAAGNIIIPPSELVAKSGADYDVDKLTTFMPNIDKNGRYVESAMDKKTLKRLLANAEKSKDKGLKARLINTQKAALENELIASIRAILETPSNFATLVRPNDTYLLTEIADELQKDVIEYDRFENEHGQPNNVSSKGKKAISPTRVLEAGYNLHKHDVNMVGKQGLGIVALENALHPVFNSLGAKMPKTYLPTEYDATQSRDVDVKGEPREMRLLLNHNKTADGNISLSHVNSYNNEDKIADIYSQMMNGLVDVEKDAWIFYIQGNTEVLPNLLYLIKTGVPKREAIMFVSNPLVRDYVKNQRLLSSSYADVTGNKPEFNAKYEAMMKTLNSNPKVLSKYVAKANEIIKEKNIVNKAKKKPLLKSVKITNPFSSKTYYEVAKAGTEDIKSFEVDKMRDVINKPQSEYAYKMFLHYLEIEKQIKGIQNLKRLSNPDTKQSKTLQEISQKIVSLKQAEDTSKIDPTLSTKLQKESILSSFFDNTISKDVITPLFPLLSNKNVNDFINNAISKNKSNISAVFGEGRDGINMFITSYKNAIINHIYQNEVYEIMDEGKPFPGIPTNMTLDVQDSIDNVMEVITDPKYKHLKVEYPILEQLTTIETRGGRTLTINNKKEAKGAIADAYHNNIADLADPTITKVQDKDDNIRISNIFKSFIVMSTFQNGVGNTKYGLSNILPVDTYYEIIERGANKFKPDFETLADILETRLAAGNNPFVQYSPEIVAEPIDYTISEDGSVFTLNIPNESMFKEEGLDNNGSIEEMYSDPSGNTSNANSKLRSFYFSLTASEKEKIGTLDMLLNEYNTLPIDMSQDEFIEMKRCNL